MSQNKETKILFFSLIVTLAVLGFGGWWLSQKIISLTDSGQISPTSSPIKTTEEIEETHISKGEKWLISSSLNSSKRAAARAFEQENYTEAIEQLKISLQNQPNDPEALIYLNNAKIAQSLSLTIAVAVPTGSQENAAKEILRGVAQAQLEINETEGINGIPFQVIIANDNNNPQLARKLAEVLAKNDKILGVI